MENRRLPESDRARGLSLERFAVMVTMKAEDATREIPQKYRVATSDAIDAKCAM